MTIPFVPKEYSCIECDEFSLWHAQDELKSHIELIIDAASYSLDQICDKLNFNNSRKIEICLYHSNEKAVASLNRRIPGNMAMAPYSTDEGSLIIVQNAIADSMNADIQRMHRILAHEISHLFVREKSGSSSFLGDGLKDMKVRPWIDEGLCEYLSWRCIGKRNPIFQDHHEYIDNLDEVDHLLNDFRSNRRMSAFHTSSFLVESFIEEIGLPNFFESMTKLSDITELPTFPLKDVGEFFRISKNSTISSVDRRVKGEMKKNKRMKKPSKN